MHTFEMTSDISFNEGFISYDTYSHPSLNSFNLLCNLIHVCMKLVCLHNKVCLSIVTTVGFSRVFRKFLTGSIVNYQKFRCHNTLTCISFSSAHG